MAYTSNIGTLSELSKLRFAGLRTVWGHKSVRPPWNARNLKLTGIYCWLIYVPLRSYTQKYVGGLEIKRLVKSCTFGTQHEFFRIRPLYEGNET